MTPTDWFRVRHKTPFSQDAVAALRASCAVYRAKVEALLQHWDDLPTLRTTARPHIVFFDPELSPDGRVMSLPVSFEPRTLNTRALLQYTATRELHQYLPPPLAARGESVPQHLRRTRRPYGDEPKAPNIGNIRGLERRSQTGCIVRLRRQTFTTGSLASLALSQELRVLQTTTPMATTRSAATRTPTQASESRRRGIRTVALRTWP